MLRELAQGRRERLGHPQPLKLQFGKVALGFYVSFLGEPQNGGIPIGFPLKSQTCGSRKKDSCSRSAFPFAEIT